MSDFPNLFEKFRTDARNKSRENLFAMPYEEGFALVERIGNVDVLWITPDGTQYMTDGLAAMIRK